MQPQHSQYAAEHKREMTALVLMVDAMQRGQQQDALGWCKRMEAATDAKLRLLAEGLDIEDAEIARASAEASFECNQPGIYQAARAFMYSLRARMTRS